MCQRGQLAHVSKAIHTARHRRLREMIRARRVELGLTQTAVAQSLGRHQPFIANIESGERRLDVVEFMTLADILEIDPAAVVSALKAIPDGRKGKPTKS